MPQRIVVLPITGDYPFAATSEHLSPNTTVHTRVTLPLGSEPRAQLRERIRLLRNLGCQHLVGLVGTSEEEGFISLTFEYVPSSLANAAGRLSAEVVARLRSEAEALASSLACHGVDHTLQLSRVGIDSRQHLKYFLGVDFRIDRSLNRPEILQKYIEQANSFFSVTPRGSPAKLHQYSETMDSCTRIRPLKTSFTAVDNPCVSPRAHLKREEIPQIPKMEELGARIGRLKNYMHDLKGKTGANVKDMANPHSYIERKIAEFRLSNANIERRIAEFRESKLLKERESHPHTLSTQRVPDSALPTSPRHPRTPDSPLKYEPKGRVPAYLLHRKDQSDPKPALTSSKTLPKDEQAKAKQYRKLATKDKYCEQFLNILQDEPIPKSSPSTDSLKLSEQRVRERIQQHLQDDSAAQIQSRVKKAIRNSIKLINGLKARETIHCT